MVTIATVRLTHLALALAEDSGQEHLLVESWDISLVTETMDTIMDIKDLIQDGGEAGVGDGVMVGALDGETVGDLDGVTVGDLVTVLEEGPTLQEVQDFRQHPEVLELEQHQVLLLQKGDKPLYWVHELL